MTQQRDSTSNFHVEARYRGKEEGRARSGIFACGLLVRGTCRRRRAEKKHDDRGAGGRDNEREGRQWETCSERVVAIRDVKCRPRGLTSGPPRAEIDFYFDLIIVTPGKRPPPVISPPRFACPATGVPPATVPLRMYARRYTPARAAELVSERASRGLLRYYIYDAISLRDVNDNWISTAEKETRRTSVVNNENSSSYAEELKT